MSTEEASLTSFIRNTPQVKVNTLRAEFNNQRSTPKAYNRDFLEKPKAISFDKWSIQKFQDKFEDAWDRARKKWGADLDKALYPKQITTPKPARKRKRTTFVYTKQQKKAKTETKKPVPKESPKEEKSFNAISGFSNLFRDRGLHKRRVVPSNRWWLPIPEALFVYARK